MAVPSNTMLLHVGKCLDARWMELGIYLGLEKDELDALGCGRSTVMCAFDMLTYWWCNVQPTKRWLDLQFALEEVGRKDIKDYISMFFRMYKINPANPERVRMWQLLREISNLMPLDWRSIGLYLNIPLDRLDAISCMHAHHTCDNLGYRVLERWKQSKTASSETLRRVLSKMGRNDLLIHVEKN